MASIIITDGYNPPTCCECKAGWLEFVDDNHDDKGASFWMCLECKTGKPNLIIARFARQMKVRGLRP